MEKDVILDLFQSYIDEYDMIENIQFGLSNIIYVYNNPDKIVYYIKDMGDKIYIHFDINDNCRVLLDDIINRFRIRLGYFGYQLNKNGYNDYVRYHSEFKKILGTSISIFKSE